MSRYFLILLLFWFQESMAQTTGWTFAVKSSVGLGGVSKNVILESVLLSDDYHYGINYGAGFRTGYRFSKFLSVNADLEWQYIRDRRTRTHYVMVTDAMVPLVLTTKYHNSFKRIKLPIALHFYPFPQKSSGYIKSGIMPSLITSGRIKYKTTSTRSDGIVDSGSLKADFDIPQNSGIKRDMIFFAGLGISFTKRVSAEMTYQFNKPIQYFTLDPREIKVNAPVYPTRANQGLILSAIVRLN